MSLLPSLSSPRPDSSLASLLSSPSTTRRTEEEMAARMVSRLVTDMHSPSYSSSSSHAPVIPLASTLPFSTPNVVSSSSAAAFHPSVRLTSWRYLDAVAASKADAQRRTRAIEQAREEEDGLKARLEGDARYVPSAVQQLYTQRTDPMPGERPQMIPDPTLAQRVSEAKGKLESLRRSMEERARRPGNFGSPSLLLRSASGTDAWTGRGCSDDASVQANRVTRQGMAAHRPPSSPIIPPLRQTEPVMAHEIPMLSPPPVMHSRGRVPLEFHPSHRLPLARGEDSGEEDEGIGAASSLTSTASLTNQQADLFQRTLRPAAFAFAQPKNAVESGSGGIGCGLEAANVTALSCMGGKEGTRNAHTSEPPGLRHDGADTRGLEGAAPEESGESSEDEYSTLVSSRIMSHITGGGGGVRLRKGIDVDVNQHVSAHHDIPRLATAAASTEGVLYRSSATADVASEVAVVQATCVPTSVSAVDPLAFDTSAVDLENYAPITPDQLNLYRRTLQASSSLPALIHAQIHTQQLAHQHGVLRAGVGDGENSASSGYANDDATLTAKAKRQWECDLTGSDVAPRRSRRSNSPSRRRRGVSSTMLDKYARISMRPPSPSHTLLTSTSAAAESATSGARGVVSPTSPSIQRAASAGPAHHSAQLGAASVPLLSTPMKPGSGGMFGSPHDPLNLALALGRGKGGGATGLQQMESKLAAMLQAKFQELAGNVEDDDDL